MKTEQFKVSNIGLNRVPEITIYFWIIKVLATTIWETAADFLSQTLKLGLGMTSYIMSWLLVIVLVIQFKLKRYVPTNYWAAVVLISIVGTLITDRMVEEFNISLVTTTIFFTIALITVFISWYMSEKTLSIHSILTAKREAFYWFAILFTFSLWTAAWDLFAEQMNVGYLQSALIIAALIWLITAAFYYLKANAILMFWFAYILTRPLGSSIWDWLSQPINIGWLGLWTVSTSFIFLFLILGFVTYLNIIEKRQTIVLESINE